MRPRGHGAVALLIALADWGEERALRRGPSLSGAGRDRIFRSRSTVAT